MENQRVREKADAGHPEAQFLLSQICRKNRDLEGMIHWLLLASAKKLPDALDALGHCYEKGFGVPRDFVEALGHYDRAIQRGSGQAAYHKAELLYKSQQGPAREGPIRELLTKAAEADFVPALRAIAYLSMQQASSRKLAIDCLRRAAQRGDPVSGFNLAWCLLQGWDGDGSQQEAALWLERAKSANYPFAENLLSSLQGVRAAPLRDVPERRIKFGAIFQVYPEVQEAKQLVLSADPAITVFKEVLNVIDCAYLIFLSRPYMRRAAVIDPGSQKNGMVSQVRTSMSTYLPFEIVDIISRFAELKIIQQVGEDLSSSEPMSILCYAPGQYYRPHVDYFNPKLQVSKKLLEDGGQRTASAITYLAVPSAGGSTSFPRLNLAVPPLAGGTLWFRNCLEDGRVDDRSLHAGETVEQGEKWVVTKWFRERPTRYLEY
jgi:prolyl 4-hydroxylase